MRGIMHKPRPSGGVRRTINIWALALLTRLNF